MTILPGRNTAYSHRHAANNPAVIKPQYEQLLARSDCPAWARTFIEQVSGTLSRPEAFDSFGGWAGELLRARDGRFVLIDWPGLGAAPCGSQGAAALETLMRFRATDPAPLVGRFLAGWTPGGLDPARTRRVLGDVCRNGRRLRRQRYLGRGGARRGFTGGRHAGGGLANPAADGRERHRRARAPSHPPATGGRGGPGS